MDQLQQTYVEGANAWYNYRTEQYDWLYGAPPDFKDYLPQGERYWGLFQSECASGKSELQAAKTVFLLHISDLRAR